MASPSPSYLPVITVITLPDGSSLQPVGELRIMTGLSVTVVVDDGPDRIELGLSPPEYLPLADLVHFPALAATGDVTMLLALANSEGPSLIRQVDLYLMDVVTANATNYRELSIIDVGPITGLDGAVEVYSTSTQPSPTGTGNIAAAISPFSTTPYELAAGHILVAAWTSKGAGVIIPSGAFKILQ